MFNFEYNRKNRYVYWTLYLGIFKISWYELNLKKFTLRLEISHGWDK